MWLYMVQTHFLTILQTEHRVQTPREKRYTFMIKINVYKRLVWQQKKPKTQWHVIVCCISIENPFKCFKNKMGIMIKSKNWVIVFMLFIVLRPVSTIEYE